LLPEHENGEDVAEYDVPGRTQFYFTALILPAFYGSTPKRNHQQIPIFAASSRAPLAAVPGWYQENICAYGDTRWTQAATSSLCFAKHLRSQFRRF
jgi:hypothetical protein